MHPHAVRDTNSWVSAPLLLGYYPRRKICDLASHRSMIKGRGIKAVADCFIPDAVLYRILKVHAKPLARGIQFFHQSTLNSGILGSNINIANAIAAIFIATGQDVASVGESSLGTIIVEETDGRTLRGNGDSQPRDGHLSP